VSRFEPRARRLSYEFRVELLAIARRALHEYLTEGEEPAVPGTKSVGEASEGAFVTLRHEGGLRGCIGLVQPALPLRELVAYCAVAAARDPRFDPLLESELPGVSIEISVLGPTRSVREPADIHVGEDGIIVSLGNRKGLLLPQVATERGWTTARFLEEGCLKAGLPRDAWRSGASVDAFGADVFGEDDLGPGE
jgi:AmmeMemoRadiSam system protein A